MNRREILKAGLLAPLLGLSKRKTRSGTRKATDSKADAAGHFWMQTYGPLYDPQDIDPNWNKLGSSLVGVYSGKVLSGVKASERSVGDKIVLNNGRHYLCFELNERVYIKNNSLGIFLR